MIWNCEIAVFFLMKSATQHLWQHQLPKSKKEIGLRINLTFRKVIHQ